MVKCKECGRSYKRISNSHLKCCCGLTMAEYAFKYNLPMENLVDNSEIIRKERTLEEKQSTLEKITRNKRKKSYKNLSKISFEEEQFLIGTLLGDGYFHFSPNVKIPDSTYLVIQHGIRQLDYLLWKAEHLKSLNPVFEQHFVYYDPGKRMTTRNTVNTKSYYLLGDYCKNIYLWDEALQKRRKYISDEFMEKLDLQGLAVWFMDDGNYADSEIWISTQSFTEEDNYKIVNFIKKKWKISFKVIPAYIKGQFTIRTESVRDAKSFCSLIEPFIFYKMKYKIVRDPLLQKAVVRKKLSFDAAHFLEDHPGKCKNLHGGRYDIWVSVEDYIDPDTGMVIDFTYLKEVVKTYIVDRLDHNCINMEVPELRWRSTTELISIWVWSVLIEFIPGLREIEIYETPDSSCMYRGPSLEDMKYHKESIDFYLKYFQNMNRMKMNWVGWKRFL